MDLGQHRKEHLNIVAPGFRPATRDAQQCIAPRAGALIDAMGAPRCFPCGLQGYLKSGEPQPA
jgi:hypothetical protein